MGNSHIERDSLQLEQKSSKLGLFCVSSYLLRGIGIIELCVEISKLAWDWAAGFFLAVNNFRGVIDNSGGFSIAIQQFQLRVAVVFID